jgi:hypothetical protein
MITVSDAFKYSLAALTDSTRVAMRAASVDRRAASETRRPASWFPWNFCQSHIESQVTDKDKLCKSRHPHSVYTRWLMASDFSLLSVFAFAFCECETDLLSIMADSNVAAVVDAFLFAAILVGAALDLPRKPPSAALDLPRAPPSALAQPLPLAEPFGIEDSSRSSVRRGLLSTSSFGMP